MKFKSIFELKRFLNEHSVPYKEWDSTNCRTVFDLLEETQKNESVLSVSGGRVIRTIRVTSVFIYAYTHIAGVSGNVWCVLREDHHEHNDGTKHNRRFLPHSVSEKMFPGETDEDAAHRALREELKWKDPVLYNLYPNNSVGQRDCEHQHSFRGIHTVVAYQSVWKCYIQKGLFRDEGYSTKVAGKTLHFHWEILPLPPTIFLPTSKHYSSAAV